MDLNRIRSMAQECRDYVIELRREFHRHPEVASEEFHTREVLMRELDAMGVSYEKVEGTGLIAEIRGAKPGKNKLLRADMDALPVAEDARNLCRGKVCLSEVEGKSHACGHDAHMAMMLGTIKILSGLREDLEGTVYCCFEEGEEETTGAYKMLSALEKYRIDECFALHVYAALEAGKINIDDGPRMAGTVGIDMYVLGKGGHGSRPDQAANPIIPAAHIVTQLDSAFHNQIDAEETVTLGLCIFRAGGEATNVIPERVFLAGTARFFSPTEGEKAMHIVNNVSEHTAACHKCTVEYTPRHRIRLQPVVNDAAVATRVRRGVAAAWGEDALGPCKRWFASESFSLYLERYPGALGFLGIRNPEYGSGAPHHNEKFDIDESVLPLGVCAEVVFALGE